MFIAQIALAPSKLRQERHQRGRHKHGQGFALSSNHAAPDGAWRTFWGWPALNMALLMELSRSPIHLKTAGSQAQPLWGP